ncbi:Asp23/Gls24 family envelope stress response protein [Sulfobacillus sp. DSM 109850]|uniref:Asp23/Gls24 family envelope stress response protein n=1 Tax=Sulfobacillus harzensis TaxID=2729629 RepID=A0A7Y0Q2E5_9FIRM|nr:Asp23/Gls24 family envelope stress response protein [Sulfobacillus harzensis]
MEKRTEWGQTIIHDEVLAALASRAALSVPGVVQMSQHGLADNLNSLVRHDILARGVRVDESGDGHYDVDLFLMVQYGVKIAQVGRQVADRVNQALKEAVGSYPDHIGIHVEGVRTIEN